MRLLDAKVAGNLGVVRAEAEFISALNNWSEAVPMPAAIYPPLAAMRAEPDMQVAMLTVGMLEGTAPSASTSIWHCCGKQRAGVPTLRCGAWTTSSCPPVRTLQH